MPGESPTDPRRLGDPSARYEPRSGPANAASPHPFAAPPGFGVHANPFGGSVPDRYAADPFALPGNVPAPLPVGDASAGFATTPSREPARPSTVYVAVFGLLVAATCTLLLAGIGVYSVMQLRNSFGNVLDLDPSGTATLAASGYADDTQIALTIIVSGLGAVLAAAYLLVTRAMWIGRSWPRKTAPFLAVLSLPALLLGPVAWIIVAAGIVATVAAWLHTARTYAALARAHRVAAREARRVRAEERTI